MPAVTSRPVGAHTPTSGGLAKAALPYADATGAQVVQVYVSNSRGWALPNGDPVQDALFRDGCAERGIPAFIHASLLVNLGSPTPATVEKSAQTLAHALRRGVAIGAQAVVFHAGSSVDEGYAEAAMRQVREELLPLLDWAAEAGGPMLLVEPSAGVVGHWPPGWSSSGPTSRRWTGTPCSGSASTPATPGRPVTTWRPRAA